MTLWTSAPGSYPWATELWDPKPCHPLPELRVCVGVGVGGWVGVGVCMHTRAPAQSKDSGSKRFRAGPGEGKGQQMWAWGTRACGPAGLGPTGGCQLQCPPAVVGWGQGHSHGLQELGGPSGHEVLPPARGVCLGGVCEGMKGVYSGCVHGGVCVRGCLWCMRGVYIACVCVGCVWEVSGYKRGVYSGCVCEYMRGVCNGWSVWGVCVGCLWV